MATDTLIAALGLRRNVYCLELAGDEDAFAVCEAETACSALDRVAPGLAIARGITPERVRTLAYTHSASELVATCKPEITAAELALEAASFERKGSVAVRARDVRSQTGVSTQHAERRLGSILVDRGFTVDLDDPDHELRVLFSDGDVEGEQRETCLIGWLAVESRRDFGERRPTDRPFFQPGSMDPLDARALVNVVGAKPGARIVDPMCGTGGLLLEAGLVGSRVVGVDTQWKMTRGSRTNLEALLDDSVEASIIHGDATALPLADGCADGVVFDAPYGRQSKIARHELTDLVGGALSEARRIADRAVVVADRSWEQKAREAGWTVDHRFERRVHGTLVRHVHVLSATPE